MTSLIPLISFFLVSSVDAGIKPQPEVIRALKTASAEARVPYRLLAAICYVESSLKPKAVNKHDGGSTSYGLCQIKLATAKEMGFTGEIEDLFDPFVNALYAAKYLRFQMDRYDQDWIKALAAYNRGSTGEEIYNHKYVNKVLKIAVTL